MNRDKRMKLDVEIDIGWGGGGWGVFNDPHTAISVSLSSDEGVDLSAMNPMTLESLHLRNFVVDHQPWHVFHRVHWAD